VKNDIDNNVYIADILTVLPQLYPPEVVADMVYPISKTSEMVNRLTRKAIRSIGIKNRPFIRSEAMYPEKGLEKEEYHPVNWGEKIINHFLQYVNIEEIGHFGVSYNVSSHKDFLPNLASQIIAKTGLKLDGIPEELAFLGCAASIFSIKSAVEYCKKSDKCAIVYNFDQCSWICDPIYDQKDKDFYASLKANLLFSDGAVGVLIIPESMKNKFKNPLMKVIDVATAFEQGAEIKMEDGRFLVGDNVKSVMPELVTNKVLKPLLKKNDLSISDIKEWSIHQGGKPILEIFKDENILGLDDSQLNRSKELFEEYGNFSSPSCLFILDSYFHEERKGKSNETYGAVVSFGAGYFLASLIYNWD